MTLEEFDLQFDILYNNISSDRAPGLTAVEKSILLSDAQENMVQAGYRAYEEGEELAQWMRPLVCTSVYYGVDSGKEPKFSVPEHPAVDGALEAKVPNRCLGIVYESAFVKDSSCGKVVEMPVVPVAHDDLRRTLSNPFRGTKAKRVLRLLRGDSVELVAGGYLDSYRMRYVRMAKPIVLKGVSYRDGDFVMDADGDGSPCELPEQAHLMILKDAVTLAKGLWA